MMKIFIKDGAKGFIWLGGSVFVIFFLFNIAGVLVPYIKKTIKFMKMDLSESNKKEIVDLEFAEL